jgi:hypothetical protein
MQQPSQSHHQAAPAAAAVLGLVTRGRAVTWPGAAALSADALWYVAKGMAPGPAGAPAQPHHATLQEAESYARVWDAKLRDGVAYALPVEARLLPEARLYVRPA